MLKLRDVPRLLLARTYLAAVAATALCAVALGAAPPANAASLLYFATFNNDAVGQAPAVDDGPFPRMAPSEVRTPSEASRGFGEPEVVSAYGSLSDQPIIFNTTTVVDPYVPTEKVGFELGQGELGYRLDVDLEIGFLDPAFPFVDNFSIALDGASGYLRTISFQTDGSVQLFQNQGGGSGVVATYNAGTAIHLAAVARFDSEQLSILLDGVPAFSAPMVGTDVTGIRFVLQDADGDGSAIAAIDNVRIAVVPEPTTLSLVALGLILLSFGQREPAA